MRKKLMTEKLIDILIDAIPLAQIMQDCGIADYVVALAACLDAKGVEIPPCKVGDKVYQTDGVKVYESTINNVIYVTEGVSFDKNAIGKSIFLTREDVEKESEE